jgi:hypothetical protein
MKSAPLAVFSGAGFTFAALRAGVESIWWETQQPSGQPDFKI